MEFTIYRKSWRRGGTNNGKIVGGVKQLGDTKLLNTCNMFCCLGMIEVQMGVDPEHLIGIGCPEDVEEDHYPEIKLLVKRDFGALADTKLATKAININDDKKITEEKREKHLTALFATRGHKLKFVNREAPKKWQVAEGC